MLHLLVLRENLLCTTPLYHLCQCAVTPPWTAYAPPRGAAAACSGSSSAAGCSRCCLPEGQTRQTMTTKGGQSSNYTTTQTCLEASEIHFWGACVQQCCRNLKRFNDLCRYLSTLFSLQPIPSVLFPGHLQYLDTYNYNFIIYFFLSLNILNSFIDFKTHFVPLTPPKFNAYSGHRVTLTVIWLRRWPVWQTLLFAL